MKRLIGGLLIAATMLTPVAPVFAQAREGQQLAQRGDGNRGPGGNRGQGYNRGGGGDRGQRPQTQRPQEQRQRPQEQRQSSQRQQVQRPQAPRPQAQQQQRRDWSLNRDRPTPQVRRDGNGQAQRQQQGQRQDRNRGAYDRNNDGRVDRQWDRNRNGDLDRRWDRNNDNRIDRRYRDGRQGNNWNREWRSDRRYDWRGYRNQNRNYYRLPRYYNPYRNRSYTRFSIGFTLGSLFYSQRYWINDPGYYRLPPAYGGYRWVRYYNDALLVDTYNGEVVDVIHDFFW